MRIAVLLLVACLPLTSAEYVVWSEKGSDKKPGTSAETAWKTLAQAAARAGSGDTVHLVRGSVFREVPSFKQGVTIQAVGPESLPPPVICGSIALRGWKAWDDNRRVYVADCAQAPAQLYVDNRLMLIARYPDTGWLKSDGADNSSIRDADLAKRNGKRDYWKGGQVRWRKWSWWYETRPITGSSGDRLRLGGETVLNRTGEDGGYYIDNLLSELDAPGEWYYDADANRVYLYPPEGVDPTKTLVEAAVVAKGPGSGGLTWRGICFRHFTGKAMNIGRKTVVDGCVFEHIGDTAISVSWHGQGTEIMNATFRDIHNVAISWNEDPALETTSRIHHNRFERIGTIAGYGGSGTWHAAGVVLSNVEGLRMDHNRIFGTGYAGVIVGHKGNLIERNVFKGCMATLNDGAAIYTNCDATVIRENIVLDTVGDLSSSHSWYPLGHGIWLEFLEEFKDSTVIANTVCGSGGHGLSLSNNYHCEIRDNVFFDNLLAGLQLSGRKDKGVSQDHIIEGNQLVTRGDRPEGQPYNSGFIAEQACLQYQPGIDYGRMKGNIFCDTTAQRFITQRRKTAEDHLAWQRLQWADQEAIFFERGKRKPNSGAVGLPFCFINDSDEARDVPIPTSGTWLDLHGERQEESVRIEPWRSVVLILAKGSAGDIGSYVLASGDDRATVAEEGATVAAADDAAPRKRLNLPTVGSASQEAVAAWDERTRTRLATLVKGGKHPSFNMRRMDFTIKSIDDAGTMQVEARGMRMGMPYGKLDAAAKAALGMSMTKVGGDELDHAVAAFWLLVAQRPREATEQLMGVGAALGEEVRSAFSGDADDS